MFGPKMGTWMVRCESDPRWNKTGRAKGLVCSGVPQEVYDWINHCKEVYGEPPEDVMCSFMKD